MKTLIPIALICFTLGFTSAWFIRPGNAVSDHAAAAKVEPTLSSSTMAHLDEKEAAKPMPNSSRHRDAAPKKSSKDDFKEQIAEQGQKMVQQMLKKTDTRHLQKLTQSLNLTPEQIKNIEVELEKRRDLFTGEDIEKMGYDPAINRQFSQSSLDEMIMKDLTNEQKEALVVMRQEERKAKVDSSTLKNLGRVTEAVTLNDAQRAAIYDTLAAEANRKIDADTGNLNSYMMESMGMNVDDLGMQSAMMDPQVTEKIAKIDHNDPNAMTVVMREAMTQKAESQVNLIAPHLDPQQIQQYRANLMEKVNSAMGLLETGIQMQEKIKE